VLSQFRTPFTLWGPAPSAALPGAPRLEIESEGLEVRVRLTGFGAGSAGEASFPANLALWEIDWDCRGGVFRSRWQAARAWQGDDPELTAAHVYPAPGSYPLVARAFDTLGKMSFSETHSVTL
jgi:hypothetical protein